MSGIVALQGGGPFAANDELDRRLLTGAGASDVVVLPTADAFEHPERLVAAAMNWGERLGVVGDDGQGPDGQRLVDGGEGFGLTFVRRLADLPASGRPLHHRDPA